MRGEYEELECPFCEKGKIVCLHFPSTTKIRRVSGSFGRGYHYSKSKDVWIVMSGCPICGKSKEEIERELKRQGII